MMRTDRSGKATIPPQGNSGSTEMTGTSSTGPRTGTGGIKIPMAWRLTSRGLVVPSL